MLDGLMAAVVALAGLVFILLWLGLVFWIFMQFRPIRERAIRKILDWARKAAGGQDTQ